VREQKEWDAGHIPGSVFECWHDITALPEGLDPGKPVAVICGSGQRAATGVSLVARFGAEQVIHVVDGGVPKWGRLGHSLQKTE
jgi:rhodanese-related sulfurtransferase